MMPDCAGGFRIKGTNVPDMVPAKIKVAAAYDLPGGNPFSQYSPIDFQFDKDKHAPLEFTFKDIEFEVRKDNRLVIVPLSENFDLQVKGFDTNRDLRVRAISEEVAE